MFGGPALADRVARAAAVESQLRSPLAAEYIWSTNLSDGANPGMRDRGIHSTALLLASRIPTSRLSQALTIVVDSGLPRGDSCRLRIKLADGQTLEHAADYPKGSIQVPMSVEDHAAKFEFLTAGLLSPARQGEVRDLVGGLTGADRIDELLSAIHERDG